MSNVSRGTPSIVRRLPSTSANPSREGRRNAWAGAEDVYLLSCLGASVVVGGGMYGQWAVLLGVVFALPAVAIMMKRWASRQTRTDVVGLVLAANIMLVALSCIWSVYRWASILELLKAVAVAGLFDGARHALGSSEGIEHTAQAVFWGGVALAGTGSVLYLLSSRGILSPRWTTALRWLGVNNAGRLGMPFAYANTLAAYLLLPVVVGAVLVFLCSSPRRRWIYTAGLLVLLVGIALTESRGGILALGFAAFALPVLGFRRGLLSRLRLKGVLAVYGCLIAGVGLLALIPSIRQSVIVPVLERIIRLPGELMNPVRTTADAGGRVAMVGDALRYFVHFPVLGSGAGTYSSVYMQYRATMLFSTDPHSVLLQTLTELGLLGVVAQAALLWTAGGMMDRRARAGGRDGALTVALLVGTTVILLHSFIDWDFKFFAVPVLLAIAGGSAVGAGNGVQDGDAVQTRRAGSGGSAFRGAVAALVVSATTATAGLALSADLLAASAQRIDESSRPSRLSVASHLNRLDAALPFQHAQVLVQQASLLGGQSSPLDVEIIAQFERSAALDPDNASRVIDYARFLVSRSNPKAVDVYKTLTTLDPADPGTWTGLAFAYHSAYRNDKLARQALDRAYLLDPVYGEALIVDGRIAEDAGDYDRARGFYKRAVEGEGAVRTAFLLLAQLEEKRGDIPAAIRTLARAHGTFPADAQVTAALGRLGPVVTVTQPSAGTPVVQGSRLSVTWLVAGRDTAEYYDVLLAPEAGSWSVLERDLGASCRSYVWSVPDDIPDGTYRIVVAARAPSLMTGTEGDGLSNGASPRVRVGS